MIQPLCVAEISHPSHKSSDHHLDFLLLRNAVDEVSGTHLHTVFDMRTNHSGVQEENYFWVDLLNVCLRNMRTHLAFANASPIWAEGLSEKVNKIPQIFEQWARGKRTETTAELGNSRIEGRVDQNASVNSLPHSRAFWSTHATISSRPLRIKSTPTRLPPTCVIVANDRQQMLGANSWTLTDCNLISDHIFNAHLHDLLENSELIQPLRETPQGLSAWHTVITG